MFLSFESGPSEGPWPGQLYRDLLSEMDSTELFFLDVFSVGCEYLAHMLHMCTACMPGACEVRESTECPGTGVTDDCDPPCECWELNLGSAMQSRAANH